MAAAQKGMDRAMRRYFRSMRFEGVEFGNTVALACAIVLNRDGQGSDIVRLYVDGHRQIIIEQRDDGMGGRYYQVSGYLATSPERLEFMPTAIATLLPTSATVEIARRGHTTVLCAEEIEDLSRGIVCGQGIPGLASRLT